MYGWRAYPPPTGRPFFQATLPPTSPPTGEKNICLSVCLPADLACWLAGWVAGELQQPPGGWMDGWVDGRSFLHVLGLVLAGGAWWFWESGDLLAGGFDATLLESLTQHKYTKHAFGDTRPPSVGRAEGRWVRCLCRWKLRVACPPACLSLTSRGSTGWRVSGGGVMGGK
jgi:hypothetical protein